MGLMMFWPPLDMNHLFSQAVGARQMVPQKVLCNTGVNTFARFGTVGAFAFATFHGDHVVWPPSHMNRLFS